MKREFYGSAIDGNGFFSREVGVAWGKGCRRNSRISKKIKKIFASLINKQLICKATAPGPQVTRSSRFTYELVTRILHHQKYSIGGGWGTPNQRLSFFCFSNQPTILNIFFLKLVELHCNFPHTLLATTGCLSALIPWKCILCDHSHALGMECQLNRKHLDMVAELLQIAQTIACLMHM